jgi:hypothetical protein
MGKAGIKLKTAKTIFTMKKMKKKLFAFTPLDNCRQPLHFLETL